MANVIDMKDMRYLNLFGKITQVSTRFCFMYNEHLVFCVPRKNLSKAIGEKGKNIRKMSEILNKRIKIIPKPNNFENIQEFVENVVSPVRFKDMQIADNEIVITAGSQSKAALIGRNKRRLLELQKIVKNFFGRDLRIV